MKTIFYCVHSLEFVSCSRIPVQHATMEDGGWRMEGQEEPKNVSQRICLSFQKKGISPPKRICHFPYQRMLLSSCGMSHLLWWYKSLLLNMENGHLIFDFLTFLHGFFIFYFWMALGFFNFWMSMGLVTD